MMGLGLVLILAITAWGGICSAEPGPITPSDPASVQRGIDEAYRAGLHRVVIPPGVYRLSPDSKSGLHLLINKFKDFEIEATGVTLVFTVRDKGPVRFEKCENVIFHGATLVHDLLPFSQGKIINIDPDGKTVDIQVSKGYPTDFDDKRYYPKIDSIHLFNPQNRQWLNEDYTSKDIERLGPDSFRYHGGRDAMANGFIPGAPVAWRGHVLPDIELRECAGVKITGVIIKSGSGFCVYEHDGEGGNYYSYDLTYGPKPDGATEEPLFASNADAFHSNGMRKGPTLEDCHFEGMNDDGVPIHGSYALGISAEGNQVIAQVRWPPFCQPGDHLHLLDERAIPVEEATVTAVEPMPNYKSDRPPPKELRLYKDFPVKYFKFTLDHPTNLKFGWMIANVDRLGSGFVVRRCTVQNNRARGMLLKASNGLVEDCTLEGTSMGGLVITPQGSGWNESDYSSNIIIRHNTFRHVAYFQYQNTAQVGALTVEAYEYGQFVPLPGGHHKIVIEDNTFEDNDGPNILLSSVQDVVIRNNHFIHPMWRLNEHGKGAGVDFNSLIWMTECSGVSLQGNLVSEPGPNLKTLVSHSATASGTGFDDGVIEQK